MRGLLVAHYDDGIFLSLCRVVDMSEAPLELVARWAPFKALEVPAMILTHPDLWFDGRWEE